MDRNAKSSLLWAWEADFDLSACGAGIGAFSGSGLGTSVSSKSSIPSRAGDQGLSDEGNLNDQEMSHNWQDTVSFTEERSKDLAVGLKLGKRKYFEDVAAENDAKIPLAQLPCESVSSELVKKSRVSHQSLQSVCCQVEGCTDDLVTAKDYHRKHKVCEAHSKWPLVIVAGQERRFCQQCSRFHALSKFDQKKRSCRRRLSDHNARRRKPQPEIISFSSTSLQPSAIANQQQMNFLQSKASSDHSRDSGNSKWESLYAFKFPRDSGLWQKTTEAGGSGGTLNLPKSQLYYGVSTHSHKVDMLLPLKSTTAKAIDQGSELSMLSSNLDGAPDLRRALSLLSVGSWVPLEHGQTSSLGMLVDPNRTVQLSP